MKIEINRLRLIVNNTNAADPSQATRGFVGSGDFTWAHLVGNVNYSVPEPGSIVLGCIALCSFLALRLVPRT